MAVVRVKSDEVFEFASQVGDTLQELRAMRRVGEWQIRDISNTLICRIPDEALELMTGIPLTEDKPLALPDGPPSTVSFLTKRAEGIG